MDADGFEDDYEEEVEQEEVLFGIEKKKKAKTKKLDELDELFEQGQDSDEDIYATEEFDRFNDIPKD